MSPPVSHAPSHLQYIDVGKLFRFCLEWTASFTPRLASQNALARARQSGREQEGGACVQRTVRLVPLVDSGTATFWTNNDRIVNRLNYPRSTTRGRQNCAKILTGCHHRPAFQDQAVEVKQRLKRVRDINVHFILKYYKYKKTHKYYSGSTCTYAKRKYAQYKTYITMYKLMMVYFWLNNYILKRPCPRPYKYIFVFCELS